MGDGTNGKGLRGWSRTEKSEDQLRNRERIDLGLRSHQTERERTIEDVR